MTKAELIEGVSRKVEGVTKAQIGAIYDAIFEEIVAALKDKSTQSFSVKDFGTFKTKERKERKAVNLQTKEPITIPASTSVGFTPSKGLKKAVAK